MNRLTARRAAVTVTAGLALSFAAALPAQAADSTVTEAQWLSDVAAVTGPAQTYIDSRAAANTSGARLAIVLDIDNTSLASYFQGGYPTPATAPVLALAQDAHAKGVSVFFVSARTNLIDLATKYNLTHVGYTVDGLYTRTLAEIASESVADFKTSQRKAIETDGYDIVANIGNNTTDLSGGYADTTYKLPDYDGLLD
ncbi:putative acid phosphatase of HAD superfamily subfamily IIIB [Streptomyces sp. Ag109_O5-1]|uniref:HAD family acid phosphatase n=1 Tax=Streptomyces sp. Ag109_O5-1 TaxID=1938851 RepID=UPI000F4FF276|nr:HAD family acid phosphatase [Streptomyces sp. Ag109_O5-1]RPE42348.1 putative acid phosphatase of HAD superfamily subfamily IIIB [Streptomyces sp. Ag109_O5-1]